MIKSTKAFLLAGASALAILACSAEANAETFTVPGMVSFTASVSGEYAVELLGVSGGIKALVVWEVLALRFPATFSSPQEKI